MLAEGIVESGNSIPEKKRDPTEDFQLLEKLGQGYSETVIYLS